MASRADMRADGQLAQPAGPVEYQPSNGYIDRLEVQNFKSYRGKQDIGPFRSFTAVVGPNGSGKSNLMDAISFVLGVRTAHLRGSLKELLYVNSGGDTEEDRPRRGYVKLVYCTDEGEQVVFARHIQPSSGAATDDMDSAAFTSVYKVDDKTVTWEAYSQRLGSFGILVKVRNFLVFQGDIEAVAAKSPQGLTALLEQISGSEAYRQPYEELQRAQSKAEEKVNIAYSRRKAVAAERKAKKEQKDEAERFLAKQQELRELQVRLLLFQLYHLREDRDTAVKEREVLQAQADKAASDHARYESDLEGAKKAVATAAKAKLAAEKELARLQKEKEKKRPDVQRAKEAVDRLTRSIATQEEEIAELEGKAQEKQSIVTKLNKELKALGKARAKLESEAARHSTAQTSGTGAEFASAAVQEEYAGIKQQVAAQTAQLEGERDTLSTQLKAEQDALAQVEASQASHQARADTLKQQAEDCKSRGTAAAQAAAAARSELKAKKVERTRVEDAARQNTAQRESLESEVTKVSGQLRGLGADKQEAKRAARATQVVAALKRMYPNGVYGRLTDLGKVSRRDYQLALSVAMGRHMDEVIVDTERTARDAITYLKDQRAPPMTFVPLATVKVPPVNERLRSGLGGTARLALDLVEPERPEFARAFQYAFDNTLVCDSVDEARQLAYGGAERHKVVAKDGTQFNRAGLITGGDAGSLGAKASRWDDKQAAQLKQQLEDLTTRLQALPSHANLREQKASLDSAVSGLEARVTAQEAEASALNERAAALSKSATEAAAAAAGLDQQVADKRARATRVTAELQGVEARIHAVSDKLFGPLSRRLGVSNIREYEEQREAFTAATRKSRTELDTKEAKIRNQLQYDTTRAAELAQKIKERKGLLEQDNKRLAQLRATQSKAEAALADVDAASTAAKEAVRSAETQVKKAHADKDALHKRGSGLGEEMKRLGRAQGAADSAARAAEANAHDMVAAAEVEGLHVPRPPGVAALQEVAEELGEARDAEGDVDMTDAAGPSSGVTRARAGATSGGGGGAGPGGSVLDTVDFTSLPADLTRSLIAREREAAARHMAEQRDGLKAELADSTPNLKAPEQYEAVKEKENDLTAALDTARKEAADVAAEFARAKQGRYDSFMAAFEHISTGIDAIYKELTRSAVHPLGGTAYLSLESPDEPYAKGIKYTAMPPTKRFRDMEQLSGGEKTVAALALLFALHSFRPSPFFVLDEVDAALDATNVARVAHYIRTKTRPGGTDQGLGSSQQGDDVGPRTDTAPSFQSIVISLKDIFYEKADMLVGVARDLEARCSRTFTFDLSAFGDPLPADR